MNRFPKTHRETFRPYGSYFPAPLLTAARRPCRQLLGVQAGLSGEPG